MRGITGSTLCVLERTTPKVPPPPPRSAQKRLPFWQALAVRRTPSGVIMVNSNTRSIPSPYTGERMLCPPPITQPPEAPTVAA